MQTLSSLKSVVFWVITRRRVVIIYRRFGTTYRSHLHGSRFQEERKPVTKKLDSIAGWGNVRWMIEGMVTTSQYVVRRGGFLCSGFLSSCNLDPWRWDRYVVPKRQLNNYHTTPCNYPEDHRLHQHRGVSLKSKLSSLLLLPSNVTYSCCMYGPLCISYIQLAERGHTLNKGAYPFQLTQVEARIFHAFSSKDGICYL
jgi:hypothetical protein